MTLFTNLLAVILTKNFIDILRKCVHRRRDLINNLLRRLNPARDFLERVSYYASRCSVVNRNTLSHTQKSHVRKRRREGENRRDIASPPLSPLCFVTSRSQLAPKDKADDPCTTETVLMDITGKKDIQAIYD